LVGDAKLADRIEQSPCVLDERQLGPLTDKAAALGANLRRALEAPAVPGDRGGGAQGGRGDQTRRRDCAERAVIAR
jgi:hypothetical protein